MKIIVVTSKLEVPDEANLEAIKAGFVDFLPTLKFESVEAAVVPPQVMSEHDRARLVDLLVQKDVDCYTDEVGILLEDVACMVRDGCPGLWGQPDSELLGLAGGNYASLFDEEAVASDTELDPANDEIFRIWATYAHPELLCEACHGVGHFPGADEPVNCPDCLGSGLRARPSLLKFTVIRTRQVVERVELSAATPQEAARLAKKRRSWAKQLDEPVFLQVFRPQDAALPSLPGTLESLYSESK